MPASLYSDMNGNGGGLVEDQRAFQLAFELSMLGVGLNGEEERDGSGGSHSSGIVTPPSLDDGSRKRNANMTECVPVPSSEHVAEIVGRQGCKIKALRAKTNTYIKTPVRGEEPVFVVTGRREDVGAAKREILSAAEHFSQIRASRRNSSVSSASPSSNGSASVTPPGPPSPNAPGQVTIQVRVPYRVVGLVVGPKGATIKRIQQQTHTYIVTPSRDKEPVFEVTGLPENVEKARQEIESHIAMRTGGLVDSQQSPINDDDFHSNGVDSGFHELNGHGGDHGSYAKSPNSYSNGTHINGNANYVHRHNQEATIFNFPPVNGCPKISDFAPVANGFNGFNGFSIYDNDEGIGSPSFDPVAPSPTLWPEIGDSRNAPLVSLFGNTPCSGSDMANMSRRSASLSGSTTTRLSPTICDSITSTTCCTSNMNGGAVHPTSSSSPPSEHPMVRRIRSDPLSGTMGILSPTFGAIPNSSYVNTSSECTIITSSTNGNTTSATDETVSADCVVTTAMSSVSLNGVRGTSSPVSAPVGRSRRHCLMCSESEVVAALVPCGHNLFCMECANLIVEKPLVERHCPVCAQPPTQAIRIFSL